LKILTFLLLTNLYGKYYDIARNYGKHMYIFFDFTCNQNYEIVSEIIGANTLYYLCANKSFYCE